MEPLTAKQEVIEAGRALVENGLIARTWGNISCRIDETHFAITPSGMGYDRITPNDVVVVDRTTLAYEGSVKPSGETGIHAAVYGLRPQVNFVVHTHQNAASAVSVAGYRALRPTPEEKAIIGNDGSVPRAAYALPSTKGLCKKVTAVLSTTDCTVLFMVRHGILAMGKDRAETFARAAAVESMCARVLKTEAPTQVLAFNPAAMTTALRSADPKLAAIRFVTDGEIVRVSETVKTLIPMLDDFAQLVGVDVRCISPVDPTLAPVAITGRNALLIRGCGAFVAARDEADCDAVHYLLKKECATELNARSYGGAAPLSIFDRILMRSIYVNKYSKLK